MPSGLRPTEMESHQLEGVEEGDLVGHDFRVEPASQPPFLREVHSCCLSPGPGSLASSSPGPLPHPSGHPNLQAPGLVLRPAAPSTSVCLVCFRPGQACGLWGTCVGTCVRVCAHHVCLLTVQGSLTGGPPSAFSTPLLCLSALLPLLSGGLPPPPILQSPCPVPLAGRRPRGFSVKILKEQPRVNGERSWTSPPAFRNSTAPATPGSQHVLPPSPDSTGGGGGMAEGRWAGARREPEPGPCPLANSSASLFPSTACPPWA